MKRVGGGDTSNSWCTRNSLEGVEKKTGGIGNLRKNKEHVDHKTVKISKTIVESPWDMRKDFVIQTPVKNHQLKPVWKTP